MPVFPSKNSDTLLPNLILAILIAKSSFPTTSDHVAARKQANKHQQNDVTEHGTEGVKKKGIQSTLERIRVSQLHR